MVALLIAKYESHRSLINPMIFTTYILLNVSVARSFPTVICELSGYDASVRVRQLIVLDEPFQGQFTPLSKQTLLHNHIEVETLKIFKNIASQVSQMTPND